MINYFCGCLISSEALLPFHPKWRKIQVYGAYNKITSLFFYNFPCTLAKMVLLTMSFSFSYARWICPAELGHGNVATTDNSVLCPFHLLREYSLGVLNIKERKKSKWLRCEVIDTLIGLVWWAFQCICMSSHQVVHLNIYNFWSSIRPQ